MVPLEAGSVEIHHFRDVIESSELPADKSLCIGIIIKGKSEH
jgi:hypothetical protein